MTDYFKNKIIESSKIEHSNGYVLSITDNLINGITLDLFEKDLASGSGNELGRKFKALYSSSALVVNNFALIKKLSGFELFGHKNFLSLQFERQFETGLKGTPPNLDVVLENQNTIIAFESKFLECLNSKHIKFSNSYNNKNLSYLSDFWFELIEQYKGKKLLFDAAQIIKHSIGLIKQSGNKKAILVYIYWRPKNFSEHNIYKNHQEEVYEFANRMEEQQEIEFVSMTYSELWSIYQQIPKFSEYCMNLKDRYEIEIPSRNSM